MFFFSIILSLLSLTIYSQNIQWQSATNFGCHAYYYSSAFDNNDDLIMMAEYLASPVFADTTISCPQCYAGSSNNLHLTSKVDTNGNLLIPDMTGGYNFVFDQQNNYYSSSNSYIGSHLRKADSNGNLLWSKYFASNSTTSDAAIISISVADNNSVCVAGMFYGGTALNISNIYYPMQDTIHAFAVQFDSMGNVEWVVELQSLNNNYNPNIGTQSSIYDNNGNVYIAWDYSVYKIYQGNIVWQQHYPDFHINEIGVFNSGDLFCIGCFYSPTITIGSQIFANDANYGFDFLMAKINSSNANVIWAKSGINFAVSSSYPLCEIDQNDNIYIIGFTPGNMAGYLDSIYIPVGKYLIMIDTCGTFQWAEDLFTGISLGIYDIKINAIGELLFFIEDYSGSTYNFGNDTIQNSSQSFIFAKATLPSIQTQIQSQNISLVSGWSMISTYIEPTDNNIENIFSPIVQDVIIVKDGAGMVFWPQYNINNIDSFTIGMGYQIKMSNQNTLQVSGEQIIPENEIVPYPAGWSLIAYLLDSLSSLETYLNPFLSDITIVKDDIGNVFWPAYYINMIGNMTPGEGYQMKLANATNFTYTPPTSNSAKSCKQIPQPGYFQTVKNTGSNMSLCIPKTAWQTNPVVSTELGVFSTSGRLVGSGVYTGENLAISIWGDDEYSQEIDGMMNGENFIIKIWNGESEETLEAESWKEGDEFFENNKISVVEKLSNTEFLIFNFQLHQNYPNPFSETTEISFYLNQAELVSLEIFDITGKKVRTIFNNQFNEKGVYSYSVNMKANISGIYLAKLTVGNEIRTKCLSLIK
ncbi:MAG: T9SS type A sorting domain-containing protein [Bacteroidetes bacterium]|nr:T9SS type A sorting domain-containing protein [Bacteroidota bacterium]